MKNILYLFISLFIFVINLQTLSFAIIDESEFDSLINNQPFSDENKTQTDNSWSVNKNLDQNKAKTINVSPKEDMNKVINRMYQNWLTIHQSADTFGTNNPIKRQEMSKFSVQMALLIDKQRNTNQNCWFKDIYQSDKMLIPYILSSCNMSIIKWTNWSFLPNNNMTKAEAITITMRIIRNELDTNANPWYKNYYNTARAYWVTFDDIENMESIVTRWEVAIMMYRAYNFIR